MVAVSMSGGVQEGRADSTMRARCAGVCIPCTLALFDQRVDEIVGGDGEVKANGFDEPSLL